MQRVFTEDVRTDQGAIRWPKGDVRDYSPGTWADIARSLGSDLDAFSKPLDEALNVEAEPPSTEATPPRRRGRPPKSEMH